MKKHSDNWWVLRHSGMSETQIEKAYRQTFKDVKVTKSMELQFVARMLGQETKGMNNLRALDWAPSIETINELSSMTSADRIKEEADMWSIGLLESPTIIDLDAAFIGFMRNKRQREIKDLEKSSGESRVRKI
ncbi:hypothetical protein N9L54_01555 [Porticoccaceae bacterium]|nr:hypothetical protein [Porticoccaceae bacterium]